MFINNIKELMIKSDTNDIQSEGKWVLLTIKWNVSDRTLE